jgi:hypothetical protein
MPGPPGPGVSGTTGGGSGLIQLLVFVSLLTLLGLAAPRLGRWLRPTPDVLRPQYTAPIELPG